MLAPCAHRETFSLVKERRVTKIPFLILQLL